MRDCDAINDAAPFCSVTGHRRPWQPPARPRGAAKGCMARVKSVLNRRLIGGNRVSWLLIGCLRSARFPLHGAKRCKRDKRKLSAPVGSDTPAVKKMGLAFAV